MSFRIVPLSPIQPKGQRRRARVQPTAAGQRHPRLRDKAHLAAVAQLSCVVTDAPGPSECAHVRYADGFHRKRPTGMAEKPDDMWVVPLCAEMHRLSNDAQHGAGERAWWERRGIDPLALCRDLYAVSPNVELMEQVVALYQRRLGQLRNPNTER